MGQYADTIRADSPAFWYRCNEHGGTFSFSQFGHTFPAMIPGMPTTNAVGPTPELGYTGIARDGGGVFVTYGNGYTATHIFGSSAPLAAPYAVEAWVAQLSWAGAGYAQSTMELLLFGTLPTTNRVVVGYTGNQPLIEYVGRNSTGSDITTVLVNSPVQDGNYHHYVCAVASAGTTLWVDGAILATASLTPEQYSVGGFSMGFGDANAASSGFHGGRVGTELALYPGGLTSAQISAHYAAREILTRPTFRNGLQGAC
jgi:hypothetical protein